MRVVDKLFLSRRASHQVVEFQWIYYLLGCMENQIVLLDKLEQYPSITSSGEKGFEQILSERLSETSKNIIDKYRARKGKTKDNE